ncbi:MAG: hypothetical protein M3Y57_15400 [Acidobacteriota bacterium]|nr:hypothetical protein [Acidobacteriota bacterium]
MQLSDTLSICALLVALVALLVSWYNLQTADRAARNDVIAELRGWADAVIDLLSEAGELCGTEVATLVNPSDLSKQRLRLVTRASALLDRGRFFFPNLNKESYGTYKPPAFRGLRSPILDLLMLSFELLRSFDPQVASGDDPRRKAFTHLKRAFVSAIQLAISPSAPTTVKKYEAFLPSIPAEPLPEEIRTLARVTRPSFELKFSSEIHVDAGDQT